jgi:hypothetical protein
MEGGALTRCCVCSDYNECVHRVGDYKSGEEEEDDDDDHESFNAQEGVRVPVWVV